MTKLDPAALAKRPAVEEFIRLVNTPASQWGMADSDALDLCNYILRLEASQPQLQSGDVAVEWRHGAWRPYNMPDRIVTEDGSVWVRRDGTKPQAETTQDLPSKPIPESVESEIACGLSGDDCAMNTP